MTVKGAFGLFGAAAMLAVVVAGCEVFNRAPNVQSSAPPATIRPVDSGQITAPVVSPPASQIVAPGTSPGQVGAETSPLTADVVVSYVQDGGPADPRRSLTMSDSGIVTVQGPTGQRQARLDQAEFQRILQEFDEARFLEMQSEYTDAQVTSRFSYSITYAREGRIKAVIFEDGASIPAELEQLRALLQDLVRRVDAS